MTEPLAPTQASAGSSPATPAILQLLETATEGSEELDAQLVAYFNNALLKRYPPSDDFGPKSRWQFWSLDGNHFLGNESKFKVVPYTRDIEAALTLIHPGRLWCIGRIANRQGYVAILDNSGVSYWGVTPAIALVRAALVA